MEFQAILSSFLTPLTALLVSCKNVFKFSPPSSVPAVAKPLSKKFFNEDGSSHYKKHKIFLYKEDFAKFKDAFTEAIGFIEDKKGAYVPEERTKDTTVSAKKNESTNDFIDVSFDDI